MGMLYTYEGVAPRIDPTCFVAPGAVVVGDVWIGRESSVWFGSVVRGDVHYIRIGERTNVQDGCILHVRNDLYPLIIGDSVTLGHGVVIQGSTLQSHVLVGMGATILDNCTVGEYSIVAAGALLAEGTVVPPNTLVMGVPAKPRRELTPEERASIDRHAASYVEYRCRYQSGGFKEVRSE